MTDRPFEPEPAPAKTSRVIDPEAQYRALFGDSPLVIGFSEIDGRWIEVNNAAQEVFGYTAEEFTRRTVFDVTHPDDRESLADTVLGLLGSNTHQLTTQMRGLRKNGDIVDLSLVVTLIRDHEGNPDYFVSFAVDREEVHLLQSQLVHQSLHDSLTGLPNRHSFLTRAEEIAASTSVTSVALCQLDIDGFWLINDAFGPRIGDRLLVKVAEQLQAVFGSQDALIGRVGGDEFAVLVRNPTGTGPVARLVDDLTERLSEPVYLESHPIAVSVSAGIVTLTTHNQVDPNALLRASELGLAKAKQNGKAQWAEYDSDEDRRNRDRLRLTASLGGGLENGELELRYHSVHRLDSGNLVRLRAEPWWKHPERGLLGPNEFLFTATCNGLALQVCTWTMHAALREAAARRQRHGSASPAVQVTLASRYLRDPELLRKVRDLLAEYDYPPEGLAMELPEAALRLLNQEQIDDLSVLTELGVRLMLTGAGSASPDVAVLEQLTITEAVLATALSDQLGDAPSDQRSRRLAEHTVRHLAGLGEILDFTLSASNVSSDEHAEQLQTLGVVTASGPRFAADRTDDEVETLLTRSSGSAAR